LSKSSKASGLGWNIGKVYDLEQVRYPGMPTHPAHRPGYLYVLYRHHKTTYDPKAHGGRSSASGLLVTMEHAGTHFDALSHQALNLKLHGGVPVSDVETPLGFTKLGVETVPPVVARGVLLDVPRSKGLDLLPACYEISSDDLRSAMTMEKVSFGKGDVVLVRTGYGRFWSDESKYEPGAGVSLEASRWIAEKSVRAVGSDNASWELSDAKDPKSGITIPGHVVLLVENGIHLIEHVYLEELSRDRCYEFLFVCTPLKLKGATGSPVRPIAIAAKR